MSTTDFKAEIRPLNSIRASSRFLGISVSSVTRLVKTGEIPSRSLGCRILVPGWYLSDMLKRPTGEVSQ